MVLAGRYRIVARIGSGGMGEVYRADDLKLGQPVALKFLPLHRQNDPRLHDRLTNEVRLARQVSHPNICPVYDLGQAEGLPFLAMEYIDGENLECLLRRIGRLPPDKAIQMAQQLCAGLATIHEKGILHRDLKPANVMLDGHGQVRITDFGVAGLLGHLKAEEVCGTPQYMAPEQLTGRGVTVRSDLYSLGLVLFEIFTGRPVFPSAAARLHDADTPTDPGQIVEGLDAGIARAIGSCLEPDPDDRPGNALSVLAALPGGDPFQAMLATGQTPPPEAVADVRVKGRIGRRTGGVLMSAVAGGTLLIALAAEDVMLFRRLRLEKPPEALADSAQRIVRSMGHPRPPTDWAYGFGVSGRALDYLELDNDPRRWARLQDGQVPAMYFWYRSSSGHLVPSDGLGNISVEDPPSYTPGTNLVLLDPSGRLLEFRAVPALDPPASTGYTLEPDWPVLFSAAGLSFREFEPSTPRWARAAGQDRYRAWDRIDTVVPAPPIHVEAGILDDAIVFFRRSAPWGGSVLERGRAAPRTSALLYQALFHLIIAGCIVEALRNLRRGRGDRTGALRLASYVLAITMIRWLLQANHAADLVMESGLLVRGTGVGLYHAIMLCWIPYMALEPHIRRRWPEKIVSWARLLAGRFRDPLVGRDVLIGLCGAVVLQLVLRLYYLVPVWLGRPLPRPETIRPETLLGPGHYLGEFLSFHGRAVFLGFGMLFFLLFVRFLLRSEWLAAVLLVGLATGLWYGEISTLHPYFSLLLTGLRMTGFVFILRRFGVLAAIVAVFFDAFLNTFPITIAPSPWYAENSIFAIGIVIGLAAYALHTAIGSGSPRFGAAT